MLLFWIILQLNCDSLLFLSSSYATVSIFLSHFFMCQILHKSWTGKSLLVFKGQTKHCYEAFFLSSHICSVWPDIVFPGDWVVSLTSQEKQNRSRLHVGWWMENSAWASLQSQHSVNCSHGQGISCYPNRRGFFSFLFASTFIVTSLNLLVQQAWCIYSPGGYSCSFPTSQ